MKSIFQRNFVATITMVSICFMIVAVAFLALGRSYIIEDRVADMNESAGEVSHIASVICESDSLSSWTLSMTLTSIAKSTGNHIFITDTDGRVVSCSDVSPICEHIGVVIPADIIGGVTAAGSSGKMTDLDGMYPEKRIVAARPITSNNQELLGYAFVTTDMGSILGVWKAFLGIAGVVTLAVFLVAMVMSYTYSRNLARPLDDMAEASRKFARGDFSVRVRQTDDPTDEIGALIESFNSMADALEIAEKRRSEFISNISHELRTPMTTIGGFADGILDGTIPVEEQDKYLTAIRDETKRLSRLVRDMLEVSRTSTRAADPTRRTDFDLNEMVLQIMLSFESRASKKNLDVDPQLPEHDIYVHADRDAITQVIYNLIDNAVKFAAAGSCITIKLYKESGKAYISVKNLGETIPADDLPFIFDRFHKSDRSRSVDKEGVGLGLYLVKTIINSHDEDIAVKSENGVTEFIFTLPLAD